MSSHAIPTKAGTLLVLEPSFRDFDRWNGAWLSRSGPLGKDWIRGTLEAACDKAAPTFSEDEFTEGDLGARLTLELSAAELERFTAAALASTYPPEVCYRIGRRRKPTRNWGTLLLGAWAHAVLNRAAAGADHEARPSPRLVAVPPLPANVIPFPVPRR